MLYLPVFLILSLYLWNYPCVFDTILVSVILSLCLWYYPCVFFTILVSLILSLCLWCYPCIFDTILVSLILSLCLWYFPCIFDTVSLSRMYLSYCSFPVKLSFSTLKSPISLTDSFSFSLSLSFSRSMVIPEEILDREWQVSSTKLKLDYAIKRNDFKTNKRKPNSNWSRH